jgi:hypothetical protein
MNVPVPSRRSKVDETIEGFKLTIPSKANLFVVIFMSFWLVCWAGGEYSAINGLLGDVDGGNVLFMVVWLTGWTCGGAAVVYIWLWSVFGKDIVMLRKNTLSIKRDVFGLGWTRVFDLRNVKNIWVMSKWKDKPLGKGQEFRKDIGPMGGIIVVECGTKTIRFGAVDEAEAQQIVSELKARHAFGGERE